MDGDAAAFAAPGGLPVRSTHAQSATTSPDASTSPSTVLASVAHRVPAAPAAPAAAALEVYHAATEVVDIVAVTGIDATRTGAGSVASSYRYTSRSGATSPSKLAGAGPLMSPQRRRASIARDQAAAQMRMPIMPGADKARELRTGGPRAAGLPLTLMFQPEKLTVMGTDGVLKYAVIDAKSGRVSPRATEAAGVPAEENVISNAAPEKGALAYSRKPRQVPYKPYTVAQFAERKAKDAEMLASLLVPSREPAAYGGDGRGGGGVAGSAAAFFKSLRSTSRPLDGGGGRMITAGAVPVSPSRGGGGSVGGVTSPAARARSSNLAQRRSTGMSPRPSGGALTSPGGRPPLQHGRYPSGGTGSPEGRAFRPGLLSPGAPTGGADSSGGDAYVQRRRASMPAGGLQYGTPVASPLLRAAAATLHRGIGDAGTGDDEMSLHADSTPVPPHRFSGFDGVDDVGSGMATEVARGRGASSVSGTPTSEVSAGGYASAAGRVGTPSWAGGVNKRLLYSPQSEHGHAAPWASTPAGGAAQSPAAMVNPQSRRHVDVSPRTSVGGAHAAHGSSVSNGSAAAFAAGTGGDYAVTGSSSSDHTTPPHLTRYHEARLMSIQTGKLMADFAARGVSVGDDAAQEAAGSTAPTALHVHAPADDAVSSDVLTAIGLVDVRPLVAASAAVHADAAAGTAAAPVTRMGRSSKQPAAAGRRSERPGGEAASSAGSGGHGRKAGRSAASRPARDAEPAAASVAAATGSGAAAAGIMKRGGGVAFM